MWKTKETIPFFIILGGLFILVQCRLKGAERQQAEKDCVEQSKVDYSIVMEVYKTLKVPDDKEYKDYLNCYYQKQGFQNEAGQLLFSELKKVLIEDGEYDEITADKILYPCKKILPNHPADEHSVLVLRCIFENAP